MKAIHTLILGGLLALTAGCRSPQADLRGIDSMWSGEALRAASLNQAIVTQATLFPYHFETGTATLNELGRRDIALLGAHFHDHSGMLSVRRAGAAEALYAARLAAVRDGLSTAGVPAGQIALVDALPGGDGMDSGRVLHILTAEAAAASTAYASGVSLAGSSVQQ